MHIIYLVTEQLEFSFVLRYGIDASSYHYNFLSFEKQEKIKQKLFAYVIFGTIATTATTSRGNICEI